jgi:hypothetical protein
MPRAAKNPAFTQAGTVQQQLKHLLFWAAELLTRTISLGPLMSVFAMDYVLPGKSQSVAY